MHAAETDTDVRTHTNTKKIANTRFPGFLCPRESGLLIAMHTSQLEVAKQITMVLNLCVCVWERERERESEQP